MVILYHPDRFAGKPESLETYESLMKVINRAKEEGDMELLREIASDPTGFVLRQGWVGLDFSDEKKLKALKKLFVTLQAELVEKLEPLNSLRESPSYELHNLSSRQPGLLDETAAELSKSIAAEIAQLEAEAENLKSEIDELTEMADSEMVS